MEKLERLLYDSKINIRGTCTETRGGLFSAANNRISLLVYRPHESINLCTGPSNCFILMPGQWMFAIAEETHIFELIFPFNLYKHDSL